ncbi:MAG TPA: pyridoxal phosphate-dependent aminotransferase [Candidatus Acidoferrum sp.]|nr:pyridoxal phosphate-dependent aminotransferase [Candidatus Acidoferrum sp.]
MTKYADRVNRIASSPTLAVLMAAEQYKARGIDVVDFGPGEPDFPTPDHIKRAAIQAIEQNFTKYTAVAGIMPLRDAITRWHAAEFGSNYEAAECLFSSGGKHALFDALNALIQKGDEVIVPVPYWVSFPEMVKYTGGVPVYIETHADEGFTLRAAAVEKAIGPRTRMIIVNSPGNPTGAVIPREEFERILAVCKKRDVWVLADECYSHFVYDGGKPFSIAGAPDAKSHVIVAGSLSKTFAMTGWRAGFALAPKAVIDVMARLQSQSTSNTCSITQKAALAAVTSPMDSVRAMLAEYARRRERILKGIRAIPGVTCTSPQGAFYIFPSFSQHLGKRGIPADTAALATQMLEQSHVALVAGEAFGAPGYVRISYATSMERIDEGLRRIERYFAAAVNAA